jgi:transposase-like protein
MIYTTNTIEDLNRGIRKYTKSKAQFSDDTAAQKAVYLAIMKIEKMEFDATQLGSSPTSICNDL